MDEFKDASPPPWTVDEDGAMLDANGEQVGHIMPKRRARDAALVSRAVNAFGPMREALAELEEAVSTGAAPFKPEYALEWMIREGGEATVKPELLLKCVRALRAANGEGER